MMHVMFLQKVIFKYFKNLPYFLIIFTFFFVGCDSSRNQEGLTKIKIEDKNFWVEVVETPEKRKMGLMNRTSLKKNHGMLFVFDESQIYPFWMKNTLIPLRIIWVDKEQKVVEIQEAIPCKKTPCKIYKPSKEALFVLEVNLDELNELKEGMRIDF